MSYPFTAALLDTSVAVKWFLPEEDSVRAINLQESHVRDEVQLYAPDILLMELANALRYSPLTSAEEIPQALELLSELNITTIEFELEILFSAVTLSLENNLAIYDSYFLALAQALELPLITADRRMLSRLTAEEGTLSLADL